jgi:hypothetical protein
LNQASSPSKSYTGLGLDAVSVADSSLFPKSLLLVIPVCHSMSPTPPNREPAVVVDALIRILLSEAQILEEPIYPSPSHQMPSLPYSHH